MKSFKYYLLFMLITSFSVLYAEENRQPTQEEMQLKKWTYLVTNANLTESQAQQVEPFFKRYESGIWELHKRNRPARKEKTNSPNYEELNERYIERETKQAELLKQYHSELKKVLSPETLHNYYKAENSYKRQLIYEMQNNNQHRRQSPQNKQ